MPELTYTHHYEVAKPEPACPGLPGVKDHPRYNIIVSRKQIIA